MNKKVLFLVLSATLLSFSNNSYANSCSEAGLIEVNGHGQVEAIPDLEVIVLRMRKRMLKMLVKKLKNR